MAASKPKAVNQAQEKGQQRGQRAATSDVPNSAAARRAELIDCALRLFMERGYERTTINDIIGEAGLSKGGFYHHFSAKEDLLDAVVTRMTEQVIAETEPVRRDHSVNALNRLNRFFALSLQWKTNAAPQLRFLSQALLKAENQYLFQRMVSAASDVLRPVLVEIITQGEREGMFSTPEPDMVAEVLIALSHERRQVIAHAFAAAERKDIKRATEDMARRLEQEATVINRLLGQPDGSVHMVDRVALRAFFKASVRG